MNNQRIAIVRKDDIDMHGMEAVNGRIVEAGIDIAPHFGNTVGLVLEIEMEDDVHGKFMPMWNMTGTVGWVAKAVYETIGERNSDDSQVRFSSLYGTACRVLVKDGKIAGIGAFLSDRWLTVDAVRKWIEEK